MKVFPLIYLHLDTIYEGIPFDIVTPETIYEGIPFDIFTPRHNL